MPIPAILLGAVGRTAATTAARSTVPAATGAASAPLTRRAIREASGSKSSLGGLAKDSLAAFGGFSAVSSITSAAQGPLESIVGYALQLNDFQANLAMAGLSHSMHQHTQLAITEAAKALPPTVEGYDDSDMHAIENGGFGFSAKVLGVSPRVRSAAIATWNREGYVTNRGLAINPTDMNVMSHYSRYVMDGTAFSSRGITPEARSALGQAFARGVNVVDDLSNIGASSNAYTG